MTLEEKFLEELRKERNDRGEIPYMWALFNMLFVTDPNFLQNTVDNYKNDPEDYFRKWHKGFRQWDNFQGAYIEKPNGDLTDEEVERREEVLRLRRKYRSEEGTEKSTAEEWRKYTRLDKELRLLNTKRAFGDDGRVSIDGKLDSLMWEAFANAPNQWYILVDEFFRNEFPEIKRQDEL